MAMRLPDASAIRHQIADAAAALSEHTVDQYLALIGAVVPIGMTAIGEAPWRLASYHETIRSSAPLPQCSARRR